METPSNPMLKIFDVAAVAAVARARGVVLAVDNTFATPMLQRPLALGASLSVHSTTKYLNGHFDVVGGAVMTSDAGLAERLRFLQKSVGGVPGPFDCYLVLRGAKIARGANEATRRGERPRRRRLSSRAMGAWPACATRASNRTKGTRWPRGR